MKTFLTGCALFAASFFLHVSVWKVRLPKNHTSALLLIFFSVLLIWSGVAGCLSVPLIEFLHGALFFVSASLCYVITYSAVEGDSPTLSLMRFLAGKKGTGCSENEIIVFLTERPFIRARLAALLSSSLIKEENGRYFIAGKPSFPFQMILAFRKVFGAIPKGG